MKYLKKYTQARLVYILLNFLTTIYQRVNEIHTTFIETTASFLLSIGLLSNVKSAPLVFGVDPNNPTIQQFDAATWTATGPAVTLTMPTFTVTGAVALTWNSFNTLYYALIKTSDLSRHLATVNPVTGVCTYKGTLSGTNFSSMTFNSSTGVMYVMTGSGGSNSERLYSINLTNGATTLLGGPYSVGTFGEVIAYNPNDHKIYHWSNGGMEKIDPITFIATPITMTGAALNEVQGVVFFGGNFIATDLVFLESTSAFSITPAGVVSFVATTPYQVRGLGYLNPLLLPVGLVDFGSRAVKNQVQLSWTTTSELNNDGFEIQKSKDGSAWKSLTLITGKGTTQGLNKYEFLDKNPFSGINYYRLKQIDHIGAFTYSNVINCFISKEDLVHIYPNPANNVITVTGITEGKIVIRDDLGNIVLKSIYSGAGIDISTLAKGVYFMEISGESGLTTGKFVKR